MLVYCTVYMKTKHKLRRTKIELRSDTDSSVSQYQRYKPEVDHTYMYRYRDTMWSCRCRGFVVACRDLLELVCNIRLGSQVWRPVNGAMRNFPAYQSTSYCYAGQSRRGHGECSSFVPCIYILGLASAVYIARVDEQLK